MEPESRSHEDRPSPGAGPPAERISFPLGPPVLGAARQALSLGLCAECFGRLFGRWGHGLSNPERAQRLTIALSEELPALARPCALCRGAFDRWDVWIDRVITAGRDFEWHRFSCGSRWDPEILAAEETFWHEIGSVWGESARGAFNRELGKRLERRTGALASPSDPEVVFLADLPVGRLELTVLPLYFEGRYRKLDRTLPQTRWPCRRCRGRGCDFCEGTGKTYPTSVEELVATPFLARTGAEGSRFHGMGREDIDARMLGNGRPFVLELRRPRVRTVDTGPVPTEIRTGSGGRVEVLALRASAADRVVRVKEAAPEKSYRVEVSGDVPREKINEALSLVRARAISQRTPTRVAHRRADRVRTRRIVAADLVTAGDGRFTLELRAEAGTYVKEWVEGDGGRTEPNLAGLLGAPLKVEALDVVAIHDPPER